MKPKDHPKQTIADLQHDLNALEFSRKIRETSKQAYEQRKGKLLAQMESLKENGYEK